MTLCSRDGRGLVDEYIRTCKISRHALSESMSVFTAITNSHCKRLNSYTLKVSSVIMDQ